MRAALAKRPSTAKASRAAVQSSQAKAALNVKGRMVPVSHLDKVFYPASGFTKAQVIDYYIRVSPVLLPHLQARPITLKRYPNGVEGAFFYEKRCPAHRPRWVTTVPVWTESHQEEIHYCVINDLPTLVWAANLGDLELHTFLARGKTIQQPTMIMFDLDPGSPANILECAQVAFRLKERLDALRLQSFPKTSGSKGLQICVPLNTPATYETTKPFARALAEQLAREHPELVVAKMEKSLRAGKVLVDWSQNDRHKSTVCAYSLRAKDRPTVSTPVEWEELKEALKKRKAERLTFLCGDVLERVKQRGDLFLPVLKLKQKVPGLG